MHQLLMLMQCQKPKVVQGQCLLFTLFLFFLSLFAVVRSGNYCVAMFLLLEEQVQNGLAWAQIPLVFSWIAAADACSSCVI